MTDDAKLLERYVKEHSQEAFSLLVHRHLNLVYSAALRQVGGDAHLASDVSQIVFADLARKARRLMKHPALVGWMYSSTRYAAAKIVRSEQRRRMREAEALAMEEIHRDLDQTWNSVREVIDDALSNLGEIDRNAILLRFFQGMALSDVGRHLDLSENAARMRVDRALDKVRLYLSRKGIRSTAAALGAAMAGKAVGAAPGGLAASISTSASSAGLAGFGVLQLIAMPKVQAIIAGSIVAVGMATVPYFDPSPSSAREEVANQATTQSTFPANAGFHGTLPPVAIPGDQNESQFGPPSAAPTSATPSPPQQTGIVAAPFVRPLTAETAKLIYLNLRQLASSMELESFMSRRTRFTLDDLVGEGKAMRRLTSVSGEDYSTLTLERGNPLILKMPTGETIAGDPLQSEGCTYAFYSVQFGDTPQIIANKVKVPELSLYGLNPEINFSDLRVRALLRVR